jgi:predicted Rossmann-fold nucleotide-binding protein
LNRRRTELLSQREAAPIIKRKVLVCGGRDFDERGALYAALDRLHAELAFAVVIAGGARGADTLAVDWATDRGIPTEVYMAECERLGRKAGRIRNQRMLDEGKPNLVVAFPGGKGTAGMVAIARGADVDVILVDPSDRAGP